MFSFTIHTQTFQELTVGLERHEENTELVRHEYIILKTSLVRNFPKHSGISGLEQDERQLYWGVASMNPPIPAAWGILERSARGQTGPHELQIPPSIDLASAWFTNRNQIYFWNTYNKRTWVHKKGIAYQLELKSKYNTFLDWDSRKKKLNWYVRHGGIGNIQIFKKTVQRWMSRRVSTKCTALVADSPLLFTS